MRTIAKGELELLRRRFPVDSLVELVEMKDEQAPPKGTKGRVTSIDDTGTIFVAWENGSCLGAVYKVDIIRRALVFDKKRCKECKYGMSLGGSPYDKKGRALLTNIMCGYALMTGETCLKADGTDKRGKDGSNCLCYVDRTDERRGRIFL